MADPVQVVANALAWLPVPFDAGLQGVTATKAAEVAVAALKANPEALAALLVPAGWVRRGETHLHVICIEQDLCEPLYRLPDSTEEAQ